MSTRRTFANRFLVALGLLAIANVSLADPCDDIKSSNSTGTYSVYYPSYATTCVWTYNPVVSRGGTTIDMYGTVTNGHTTSAKNSLHGVVLDAKGKASKNASSTSDGTCANGAVIEFLGSCVNGNLNLTLLQTNDHATGSVLGALLIGSGSFQATGSTFNFRVTANQ